MKSFALLLALLAAAPADKPVPAALSEDPFPPHRIADNLYYVGTKGLASYLVTTRKGHILINPSFETTVPIIKASVEQLGFKFGDVKILLNSHAHDDHVGGMALAKELTGAKVYVMRGDQDAIAKGVAGGKMRWKPTAVARVLKDGDKVTLGEVTLTAVLTPGHTRGCTTWTMQAKDGPDTRNVVIVGSPNVNANYALVAPRAGAAPPDDVFHYPGIVADYEKAFAVWKALPCDIFLGAHGNYYGLEAKYPRLAPGKPNPFVDPAGYRAYIDDREAAFRKRLAEQQAAHATPSAARAP